MKRMNIAIWLMIAAGAGIGTAATLVNQIGFSIAPPPYSGAGLGSAQP